MYWSLQQPGSELELESILNEENKTPDASPELDGEGETALAAEESNLTIDAAASDSALSPHVGSGEPASQDEKEELTPGDKKEEPTPGDKKEEPTPGDEKEEPTPGAEKEETPDGE